MKKAGIESTPTPMFDSLYRTVTELAEEAYKRDIQIGSIVLPKDFSEGLLLKEIETPFMSIKVKYKKV